MLWCCKQRIRESKEKKSGGVLEEVEIKHRSFLKSIWLFEDDKNYTFELKKMWLYMVYRKKITSGWNQFEDDPNYTYEVKKSV